MTIGIAPAVPPAERVWRSNVLRRELHRQATRLIGLATKVKQSADYPTGTAALLSDVCVAVLSLVRDHLDGAPDDQLLHASGLLREVGEHLRFVERSKVADTPWSMVEATENFLRSVAGDNTRFIIRPQWAHGYNIDGEFVSHYSTLIDSLRWISQESKSKAFAEKTAYRIYSISFPRSERLNPLLHANWGHEVGHIISWQWLETNFQAFWVATESAVAKAIRNRLEGGQPTTDLLRRLAIETEVARGTEAAMEVARKGLRELLADVVGLHLLGPAAIAAAAMIAARANLDQSPLDAGSYPPWRYRLRLMLDASSAELAQLRSLVGSKSMFEPLLDWLDKLKDVVSSESDRTVIRGDERTAIPYGEIEKSFSSFRAQALALIGPSRKDAYSIANRSELVAELAKRLDEQLPPNETGMWPDTTPAAFDDILNAGWIHYFRLVERSGKDFQDAVQVADRLVLKGVESAQVHATYGKRLRELKR